LIHQFLDSGSNHRTDQWGGSIENRCRLGLEILKVLVEIWGPQRVGVKLTPSAGYNDLGCVCPPHRSASAHTDLSMPLNETIPTFVHYITEISRMKIAYVQLVRYVPAMDLPLEAQQLDDGDEEGQYKRGVPHDVLAVYGPLIKIPEKLLSEHHEPQVRGSALPPADAANATPTRLLLNGALTPTEADKLIAEGVVDGVVFGQLWIGNPDLQRRIEAGLDVGGKGINDAPNPKTFYQILNGDPNEGYSDYPTSLLA
jgi:2,4-dienoyl-CoA reductase-like NADH-dependent reductase (Old Yellow Enzyme family)